MGQLPAANQSAAGDQARLASGRALAAAETAVSNEYLTFAIDAQVYGIDILSVREIRAWTEVTNLPNTPDFVRGIINLRGTIVPIYDLRVRLGGGRTEPTRMHVVIVVEAANGTFGLLVDSVSDILSIEERDLQPVPQTDMSADYQFLSAIVAREERMVSIINLDRLVNGAAAAEMAQIAQQQATAAIPAA
ncbi:MAG TPA: chemotaxis protein CheW [Ferrovibrio sp.]|uniref:chemotaxis protein CheW n=1 Tax=Ferrovibrio sp. TaxID=1917215 RepID=UPI002ED68D4C